MVGRPAIFLDRDGVLNDVVWRDGKPASPRSADELQIADGAVEAVAAFQAAGYLTFVVTNQPDVRRGKMTVEALDSIHAALTEVVLVDEVRACLHDNADNCDCRKPKPGMLVDLAARWNVDLTASWMLGDMDRDIQCGRAAGTRTVLLARPYNSQVGADVVARDLRQAAAWILHIPPASPTPALQD
jgi:D-glycero-D-manno-heptose 1,7-bisphosphate phosphatase